MRWLALLLTLGLLGYGLLLGALFLWQRQLLYLPSRETPSPAAAGVPEMQPVTLRTQDGLTLGAWFRPPAVGMPTLVYLHGNGGHIGHRGGRVRPYLDAGFGVLLVEYRGYGGNPGTPDEAGLYEDGRAALAFLRQKRVPPRDTVLFGESLGTVVATQLAVDLAEAGTPARALVLEAPPSSILDAAAYHYPYVPVRWLMKDCFETIERIGQVKTPLLIVHGERDTVVPVEQGRALFAAAAEPKRATWLADAGHEDLVEHGLPDLVIAFLRPPGIALPSPKR